MADLQQLVSAILRDLAKARFASDVYSRSIARYYEGDFLLRRFPIPRTEIDQAELELKFAISSVSDNEANAESREVNVAFLLERAVEVLVATFLDCSREFTKENTEAKGILEKNLSKGLDSPTMRIELRQMALRYFIESYTHLISIEGKFDHAAALQGLRQPFLRGIQNYRREDVTKEEAAKLDNVLKELFESAQKDPNFIKVLEFLTEPIKSIWRANHDARLEVEVAGEKLAVLGEATLSTLKLKMSVRNHIWNEVKIDERHTHRVLTSL